MNNDRTTPLLILDLDETLIHGAPHPLDRPADTIYGPHHIYRRPHVHDFVATCAAHYTLAVWTSASEDYAQVVCDLVLPDRPLAFLWTRHRCTTRRDPETGREYRVKDLKKVRRAGFDLDRVLMIDDTPRALERNYGNRVVVRPFTGDPDDGELPLLADYLTLLSGETNLRAVEKRGWRREQERRRSSEP